MKNENIRKMVFCAILVALIVVLILTRIGFISFGGVSITIVHIVVIIGALVLGYKYGAILGFVFGLVSLILSFLNLTTDAPFTNPILSVLPRVLFGLLIFPLYNILSKIIKNKTISSILTAILSTLLHTIMVLTLFYIIAKTGFHFGAEDYRFVVEGNVFTLIFAVLISNGFIEMGLAAFICPPIFLVLDTVIHKNTENNEIDN